jgi:acetyl esterase/lipase
MASWLFLGFALLGVVHTLLAWAPPRGRWTLVYSFFASWITIELAWHHVVIGTTITIACVASGALDDTVGWVALGIMVVAVGGMLVLAIRSLHTRVQVHGALADLAPAHDAPRFPRSHILFPFLLGRRKGVRTVRHIEYRRAAGRRLKLDVTLPPEWSASDRRPALIQIHGGAWILGDKREQGIPLLTHMAANGWVGFNINYRLSPMATWPEHLVDCKAAVAWVREHADEWGIDPDFICVTGGSAGGHLTAMVALTANDPELQPGFEDADTSVAAAVPFYGVYDWTNERRDYGPEFHRWILEPLIVKAFYEDEPHRFREASPLHRIHEGAPPFFVIHGDKDTLAPVSGARLFVERLEEISSQPVVYAEMQGAQHAFDVFPSPRSARVLEGVERFLTTVWTSRDESREELEGDLEESLTD